MTFAKRSYRCYAPAVWNSLPKNVVNNDSVTVFKSERETKPGRKGMSLVRLRPKRSQSVTVNYSFRQ